RTPGAAAILDGGGRNEVASPVHALVDPHWAHGGRCCLTRPFAHGTLPSRGAQFGTPGRTSLQAHATFIQPCPAILQSPAAITQAPRLDPDAPCVKSGRARLRPEVPRLHFGRQACPGALYRDPGPAPSSRRALLHLRRSATIRTRPPPLCAAAFTQA